MSDEVRLTRKLERVDQALLNRHTSLIEITEINDDGTGKGPGKISFVVSKPCISMHLPKNGPIRWLSVKKCADALILEFQDEGIFVHIVELKSRMTIKEWKKAKEQFREPFTTRWRYLVFSSSAH